MPLQETPSLNLIYSEPGASLYFVDFGDGTLHVHTHIEGKVTLSRMKHFEDIWLRVVIGLWERGMETIETWIMADDHDQKRFAEFFGFDSTGFLKQVTFKDGSVWLMEEMQYVIPIDKD